MPAPTGKTIAILSSELDANLARAEALVFGLSDQDFNWRPDPSRWSIAQNLTHLNIVNGQDLAVLQPALDSAKSKGVTGQGPFRYGLLSRKFVAGMEPSAVKKWKAPACYLPSADAPLAHTLQEYRRILSEMKGLMESAKRLDLSRVKTKLPALPPVLRWCIRMPLGARFELLTAHNRRHLWQAEQVLAAKRTSCA